MSTTGVVQYDIHIQYGRHVCLGAYVNNVRCMFTSAGGDIVDCIEVIWGMYTDIVLSYVHMK